METAFQILGGLVLLTAGGETVIRGAIGVARRLGVSELFIGLTLLGFGTSAPELVTSIDAAFRGSPGIAIGNVVGSNIANILLIFALVTIIKPVAVDPRAIKRDGTIMVLVSILLVAVATQCKLIDAVLGGFFFAGLLAYIVFAWWTERHDGPAAKLHEAEGHTHDPVPVPLWQSLGFAVIGLGLLIYGADLLVQGAITLASRIGLSETVIGLTIVAVGTSLPELVATLAAALKGRSDVAFGAIVGSNIYNILGILGITALMTPIPIPPDLVWRDWAAMLGAAVLLLYHAWQGGKVGRTEGLILLAGYGVYCWFLF